MEVAHTGHLILAVVLFVGGMLGLLHFVILPRPNPDDSSKMRRCWTSLTDRSPCSVCGLSDESVGCIAFWQDRSFLYKLCPRCELEQHMWVQGMMEGEQK